MARLSCSFAADAGEHETMQNELRAPQAGETVQQKQSLLSVAPAVHGLSTNARMRAAPVREFVVKIRGRQFNTRCKNIA